MLKAETVFHKCSMFWNAQKLSAVSRCQTENGYRFRKIALGLIQSQFVTEVRFVGCTFDDEKSVKFVNDIFKRNCTFHGGRLVPRTSPALLLGSNSRLESLKLVDLEGKHIHRDALVKGFLRMVNRSPLKRLTFGAHVSLSHGFLKSLARDIITCHETGRTEVVHR